MRIPIKVKYEKTVEKGSIPKDWGDVSFKDYIKYLRGVESGSIEAIYSALTGISIKMWTKPHKAELFFNIDKVLKFTRLEPTCEVPTHIEMDGEFYPIEKDFLNVPLGKYRDIIEFVNQVVNVDEEEKDDIEQIAVMSKMIAVFACKEYNSIEEIERISERIDEMPCNVVYSLGGFFLQKLTELNSGTKKKQSVTDSLTNKLKQVMVKFVAILVICITFIRYPKVILSTLLRFLKRLWVRCTGGRNYKVETVPQIKSINK